MSQLPVQPAWRLADCPEQQRWLVDGLWSEEAVGIIGGEPKCCKSFLALDLAVAVAAGIPCLRRFAVSRPGRVLLYPAEDALHIVRRRLEGICAATGVSLADLDVQVITAPSLRLDLEADRARLDATVARLKPRLLVLDPFVRLHRIDENVSGDVAPLLAFLRELQRRHAVAVAVVHHAERELVPSAPVRPCADHRNSTPGAIPTSISAATVMIVSSSLSSIAPPPPSPALLSNLPSETTSSPSSLSGPITRQSATWHLPPLTNASPQPSQTATNPGRSPNCAPPAASAPPRSTNASRP
jgi:hypothetical protein